VQEPATIEPVSNRADGIIRVGDTLLLVEVKSDARSASVASAIRDLETLEGTLSTSAESTLVPLLVVRHMGEAGSDLCRRRGISWLDFEGNADIRAPGLRIRILGQRSKRHPSSEPSLNPFANKASRVAHVLLLDPRRYWTAVQLQSATALDKGSISRTLKALRTGGYLKSNPVSRAEVAVAEPSMLLDGWDEHYRIRPASAYGLLSTREGISTEIRVGDILKARGVKATFGGLPAAAAYTKFGSFRRVRVYVEGPLTSEIRAELNISDDSRGRNVYFVPADQGTRIGSEERAGRRYSSPILTYLDLRGEVERAQEAREDLRRFIEAGWK